MKNIQPMQEDKPKGTIINDDNVEIICEKCGERFYLKDAKNTIARRFYIGTYDESFPEGDICADCATEEIGTWWIDS